MIGLVRAVMSMQCTALVCLLGGWHGPVYSVQLSDLAPVQVFAAPQIKVAPPQPLPDPQPEPVSDDDDYLFIDEADSIPDISYSFTWSRADAAAWRNRRVSRSSPGLWGALDNRRRWRFTPPPATAAMPWELGISNWRFAGDGGLDVALGSNDIVTPAWGNSARLGGISISQSSLVNAEDKEGNWQYALAVGALDFSQGPAEDLDLGPTAANSVFRYGVSPSLVLESQLQLAPDLMSTGVGGQYRTDWGRWSAGLARANMGAAQGWRYQAAYELDMFESLQLSWRGERRDPGYADLSRYTADPSIGGVRQQWKATIPLGRWGDLSGKFENEHTSLGESRSRFGFTQQFWYSPNLRVGVAAARELDSGDYDIGIRFSVPIY